MSVQKRIIERWKPSSLKEFPIALWEQDPLVLGEAIRLLYPQLSFEKAAFPHTLNGTLILDDKVVSLEDAVFDSEERVIKGSGNYDPHNQYLLDINKTGNLRFRPILANGDVPEHTLLAQPARYGGTISTAQEGWQYDVSATNGVFVVRLIKDKGYFELQQEKPAMCREFEIPNRPMNLEELYGRVIDMQRVAMFKSRR